MVDYEKLGFKAGLECHQQLDTKKLFCNCPSLVNDQNPNFAEIKRKLTVTEGELGKKDVAAEFEAKKQKISIYQAKETSSCLVELDEEPPHPLNQEALKIALQIAFMVNAKIVPEVQVMRKIVVDGSNVSGFQRTALIARNGYIETSKGKVGIPTIYLEEEAAKKIEETETTVTYSLDRLGIPLIELSTSPDLKDPEQVQEAASLIGMIFRSTEKVKRGIGSIRQDVNLSIKDHPRIELKGFQDLRSIPKVIENEIERMQKEKDRISHVRKVEPNLASSFLRPMPGSSRLYPETDIPHIKITKQMTEQIKIPELITERAVNVERKYNISPQYAREIIKYNIPFDYYTEKYKIDPKIIAHTLLEIPKEIQRRYKTEKKPKKGDFETVFSLLEKKQIQREAVIEILQGILEGKKPDLDRYSTEDLSTLEEFIKDLVNKNKGVSASGLMGDVMKKYRGKVDGAFVLELIKKYQRDTE